MITYFPRNDESRIVTEQHPPQERKEIELEKVRFLQQRAIVFPGIDVYRMMQIPGIGNVSNSHYPGF